MHHQWKWKWKVWIVGLGLLVAESLVFGLALAQDREQIEEALRIFNRAKYLHQEKKYQEAIQEYRKAAKLDKDNPFIFNAMGLALAATGEFKEAIGCFGRALKLNPDLTDVHNNLGVVYSEIGEREKAVQEFSLVLRDPSYPTHEKVLYNLGSLYLRDKNFELALMHYRRALEKQPRFAMGYRGIGLVYVATGQQGLAVENFEKALEIAPSDVESLYELARHYDRQGNVEKAQEYYRRVVGADPLSTLGRLSLQRLDALKPAS